MKEAMVELDVQVIWIGGFQVIGAFASRKTLITKFFSSILRKGKLFVSYCRL